MNALTKVTVALGIARSARSYGELTNELPLPARGYASRMDAWRRVNKIAQVSAARGVFAHAIMFEPGAGGVATYQIYKPDDKAAVTTFRDSPSTEVAYWLSGKYRHDSLTHELVFSALTNLARDKGQGPLWAISHLRDTIKADAYQASGFVAQDELEAVDLGGPTKVLRVIWENKSTG